MNKEKTGEFQRLYKIRFGTEIAADEAINKSLRLLQLFKVIYKSTAEKTDLASNEKHNP